MIQQPELGKKIADFRKAKGLTQEELVEKCNLNVRTLQRIEAGEVIPRNYTVKLIFEALDINYDNSFVDEDKGLISNWLEQFYISFIDLFNLKTNTMKKISILSIIFSAIILGLFLITTESKAQKEDKAGNQVTTKDSSNRGMTFDNFSCGGCFYEGDEIIGRDIKFKINGVNVNLSLIKLNQKTRKFNTGGIQGKLFPNKIEITIGQYVINDENVKYTADKVEKSDDGILLKGNATLTSTQNDLFEAEEIVIIYR